MKTHTITWAEARGFVQQHHRHLGEPPPSHRFSLGATKNGDLVGVAIVGRPSARAIDHRTVVEVTRLATNGTHNACSALLGACAREARRRGFRLIQTYTLETEPGTSLIAAGWIRVARTQRRRKQTGARAGRPVPPTFGLRKWRWERSLRGDGPAQGGTV